MSIEELEEVLQKNKGKITRNIEKEEKEKSLNNSYYSQKNSSITETRVHNKLNDKLDKMKQDQISNVNNSSITPFNIFNKNLQNESINYSQNVNNSMHFIKVLSPKETNNFSGYMSDQNERTFNYNFASPDVDTSMKSNNTSTAASNALKAMQDKIKQFQAENEDLRKRLLLEEERVDKEREEFQNKFLKEVAKTREIENSYRNEIEAIREENLMLNNLINEQKHEINLLKTNLNVMENEKDRHLEQNVMDKESLKQKIDSLMREYEVLKNNLTNANKENAKLKEKLNRVNKFFKQNLEEMKNYEITIQKLNEEINTIKKKSKAHINSFQNQIEEMKTVFENEKRELNEKIKNLKEKNKCQSSLIKEFEKRMKDSKTDIRTIDKAKQIKVSKPTIAVVKSVPKVKKTIDIVKDSRSRSKSKEVKSSNYGMQKNKPVIKNSKLKKIGKSPLKYKNLPTDKSYDSKKNISSHYIEDDNQYEIEKYKQKSHTSKEEIGMKNPFDHYNFNQQQQHFNDFNSLPISSDVNYSSNVALDEINNTIFNLERNIAELNRNYKNLLIKINVSSSIEEQQNLKRNANLIANNLQDQSEKLIHLKQKQQEILKNSLNL